MQPYVPAVVIGSLHCTSANLLKGFSVEVNEGKKVLTLLKGIKGNRCLVEAFHLHSYLICFSYLGV